jgi:hypothetical protein
LGIVLRVYCMHLTSGACGELVGWGSRNGESRGGLVGGAGLMRAECLRCLGVGDEFETLEVNEVVWMGVCD